jgi:hypothetical protein
MRTGMTIEALGPVRHLAVALAVMFAAVSGAAAATLASQSPRHCPAGPAVQCVRMTASGPQAGQLITDKPGRRGFTSVPWMVTDYRGAPMAFVNFWGLFSGGEPVCVLSVRHLRPVACIGGPLGSYGGQPVIVLYGSGESRQVLTGQDIAYLHRLEKGGAR